MTAPRHRLRALPLALALALLCAPPPAQAEEKGPELSNGGYMQTTSAQGKALPLPLKGTKVRAEIAGFLATVQVQQTFVNPLQRPIEAVYVFPLPERAAVHDLLMVVGDRRIRGVIKERGEARQIYEAARAAGKTAALLDQERPNIFTQSVANILPGEEIVVELTFVQDLQYRDGRYEWSFPLRVGPRFIPGKVATGRQGTGWSPDTEEVPDASRITPQLLRRGERPGYDVDIEVDLDAGLAIEAIACPTHQVMLERKGPEAAHVKLSPKDTIPNKDFVLRYEVAGAKPRFAWLTEKDERGGFFLLMLQPRRPAAQKTLAPREYVFVVDTSGSMRGFPLQQAKALMRKALQGMTQGDTFQVVGFAGSASFLFERPQAATKPNIEEAIAKVDSLQGGGGTRFLPALDLALNSPRDPGRARVVLFLSDGYIGYENEVLRYLRSNLKGANLFPMGVGSSVNRFLIEGMARMGEAEPFYLLPKEEPGPVVDRFYSYVSKPSLTDIELDWGTLPVEDLSPAYLPDLFADRPLFVVGRYFDGGRGKLTVRGRLAGKPYSETLEVELPEPAHGTGNGIGYLWARRSIADLMDSYRIDPDRKDAVRKAVIDLALRFNLMSQFTSFVAVDDRVRTQDQAETVPVAVPLPAGVEESAAPAAAYTQGALPAGAPSGMSVKRMPAMAPPPSPVRAKAMSAEAAPAGLAGLGLSGKGVGGGGVGYGRGVGTVGVRGQRNDRAGVSPKHTIAAPQVKVALLKLQAGPELAAKDRSRLEATLRKLLPQLLPAYEAALKADAHARGKVLLRLEVGPDGALRKARVTSSPFGGEAFRADLAARAQGLALGSLPAGTVLVLELSFGG